MSNLIYVSSSVRIEIESNRQLDLFDLFDIWYLYWSSINLNLHNTKFIYEDNASDKKLFHIQNSTAD